ncbi:MAG: ATP-binding protein [bacterium]|nr:ATP-binding protein [bacterium]
MADAPEPKPGPENLLKSFRAHVLREEFFPKGSTVLVGVSGRSDSVALLRLLAGLSRELGIRLVVGHVQGESPEAKADAMFVHHLATTLTLPFESSAAESESTADALFGEPWLSPLMNIARRTEATVIATAETQDDAAERMLTVLLGDDPSFRGLLTSASGMHVRPLTPFSHEACVTFLTQRGLLFRLNPDALALDTLTAKIRLLILPTLQRHVHADAPRNLAAASELLATEDSFLNELARAAREEVRWTQTAGRISFDHDLWGRLPLPLRHRLLFDAARSFTPPSAVSRNDLRHLDSRCRSLADGTSFEAGTLKISRADGILTLHVSPPLSPSA